MKKPDAHGSVETSLLRQYGQTDNFGLAVWLLRDGTLVNGSFEGNQRDLDHRHIADFYPGLDPVDAICKFMRRGNVRMGFSGNVPCFEFLVPLSDRQIARLVPWAHWAANNAIDFCAIRHAGNKRVCENPWRFLYYIAKYMRKNVFDYPLSPF